MRDSELRDLERAALGGGDAAALEKLKAAWLRDHDAMPALLALLGDPNTEMATAQVAATVEAEFMVIPACDGEPARWERLRQTVFYRYESFVNAPPPLVYRAGETNGRAGERDVPHARLSVDTEDEPDYDSGVYGLDDDE